MTADWAVYLPVVTTPYETTTSGSELSEAISTSESPMARFRNAAPDEKKMI
jgi:hypothetical protein